MHLTHISDDLAEVDVLDAIDMLHWLYSSHTNFPSLISDHNPSDMAMTHCHGQYHTDAQTDTPHCQYDDDDDGDDDDALSLTCTIT